jgi:uncharacterized membrane protein
MLHPPTVEGSVTLLGLILAAVVGTGVLFVVSLVAYRRRQTAQYLLVSLAIAGLLVRSVVGTGTVLGVVPMPIHHLVSHSLDVFIAGVVLYAVYVHAPGSLAGSVADDRD